MFLEYKKAKMGWSYLPKLINHLGTLDYKKEIIFLFETHELVIMDDDLLAHLNQLNIHYELVYPPNAVRFVNSMK